MNANRTRLAADALGIEEFSEFDVSDAQAFSCGTSADDEELNSFLREDALRLTELRTAVTYLARYKGRVVGFVSLMTDSVEFESGERRKVRRGKYQLGHADHPILPAIKIARLAVSAEHRRHFSGTGVALMQFALAKALLASAADTEGGIGIGCRLLTVDAKDSALEWYTERLGFTKSKRQRKTKTTSLFLDIHAEALPHWATDVTGGG